MRGYDHHRAGRCIDMVRDYQSMCDLLDVLDVESFFRGYRALDEPAAASRCAAHGRNASVVATTHMAVPA
jgi:hypothetical protein